MYNTIIDTLGGGRMCRISYSVPLPIRAEYKKLGVQIYKNVETTVRTGVNYSRLKSVIKKRELNPVKERTPRVNNFSWIIPNVLRYNSNTGKTYLFVAPLSKGANEKISYTTIYPQGETRTTSTFSKDYVIPSYFNGNADSGVYLITLENINSINGIKLK